MVHRRINLWLACIIDSMGPHHRIATNLKSGRTVFIFRFGGGSGCDYRVRLSHIQPNWFFAQSSFSLLLSVHISRREKSIAFISFLERARVPFNGQLIFVIIFLCFLVDSWERMNYFDFYCKGKNKIHFLNVLSSALFGTIRVSNCLFLNIFSMTE